MSSTTPVKRATLDELRDFANAVRKAGGGNPIDALMPAVPEDVSQCLIAKNLNFNCTVGSVGPGNDDNDDSNWYMAVASKEIRDKIAAALDLEKYDGHDDPTLYGESDTLSSRRDFPVYAVKLPANIGAVAREFDRWSSALTMDWNEEDQDYTYTLRQDATEEQIQRLRDFLPYLDASVTESLSNALVNEKGELIL